MLDVWVFLHGYFKRNLYRPLYKREELIQLQLRENNVQSCKLYAYTVCSHAIWLRKKLLITKSVSYAAMEHTAADHIFFICRSYEIVIFNCWGIHIFSMVVP